MEDCMKDIDRETDISMEGASMTEAITEAEAVSVEVTSEIEGVISQYSKQLMAEAEIANGDLAEIEDHLRTLAEDCVGAACRLSKRSPKPRAGSAIQSISPASTRAFALRLARGCRPHVHGARPC